MMKRLEGGKRRMGKTVSRRDELAKMYPERFGEEYRVPVRIAHGGGWAVDTVYPGQPFSWRESLPSLVDELIAQARRKRRAEVYYLDEDGRLRVGVDLGALKERTKP